MLRLPLQLAVVVEVLSPLFCFLLKEWWDGRLAFSSFYKTNSILSITHGPKVIQLGYSRCAPTNQKKTEKNNLNWFERT